MATRHRSRSIRGIAQLSAVPNKEPSMSRSVLSSLVAALMLSSAVSATAAENGDKAEKTEPATVAAPVLDAWAHERAPASSALKVLYGSYGVLQGMDVYSTTVALRGGAREANPLMQTHMGQAMAFKAVMGLSTYYAVNKLSKKNRTGAIVTMAILNGVTAAIVANNMKNSRR
jgi:uncharacterized protein DUF5658